MGDRPGSVEDGPFHIVRLVSKLHLDNERKSVLGLAVPVEGRLPFLVGQAELLALADVDVRDIQPEDGVKRTNNELFVSGFFEYLLESEIDHWVNVEDFAGHPSTGSGTARNDAEKQKCEIRGVSCQNLTYFIVSFAGDK